MMETDLVIWLALEMSQRRLSMRQLARMAGISHSWISKVLSGDSAPTYDFCAAVAKALKEDKDCLFAMAGLEPPPSEIAPGEAELVDDYRRLDTPGQREARALVRAFREIKTTYR